MAVTVVVEKCTARSPPVCRIGESGRSGYVAKSSITVVAVEDVLSPKRDEQVVEAIIVIVPDAHAAGPARPVTSVKVPSRLFLKSRLLAPAGALAKRVPESRKMSSQPSLSKSKKAQPQPRVSTMYSLRSLSP